MLAESERATLKTSLITAAVEVHLSKEVNSCSSGQLKIVLLVVVSEIIEAILEYNYQ